MGISTMCPRVLPVLLCAAAAATTSHVVDNFTSTEGMFTLTSQVPPVSTTEVSSTNAGVRLDYSSHHLEMYSGFPYAGRLLGQGNYPCAEASYLKLEYRILPSCYLFDHVELERPPWLDVTPPAGEAFFVEAFWVADETKRCDRTSITPRLRLLPTPAIWPRSTRRRGLQDLRCRP